MRSFVYCPNRDNSRVSVEICLTRCEQRRECGELAELPRIELEEAAKKLKIPMAALPEKVIQVDREEGKDCTQVHKKKTEKSLPVAAVELKMDPPKHQEALKLYERALTLKKDVEAKFLEMGAVLNDIYERKYYQEIGYQDWKQFCDEALDIKWRWALYLRAIYLKKEQLKLSDQICVEVGVKKMAVILPVMRDKKSTDHWMNEAKKPGITSDRLQAKVRHARGRIDKDEAEKIPTKYILPVYEEDAETVERALELAREVTGSESRGVQFVALCEEFRSTYEHESGDFSRKRIVIGWLKKFQGLMNIRIAGDVIDIQTGEIIGEPREARLPASGNKEAK